MLCGVQCTKKRKQWPLRERLCDSMLFTRQKTMSTNCCRTLRWSEKRSETRLPVPKARLRGSRLPARGWGAVVGQAGERVDSSSRRAVNGNKSEWKVVGEAHSPLARGAILDAVRTVFAPYHLRPEATHPTTITISTYLDSFSSYKRGQSGCSVHAPICYDMPKNFSLSSESEGRP